LAAGLLDSGTLDVEWGMCFGNPTYKKRCVVNTESFFDELEKIAFDWADMNRVLRLSRARTLRLPQRLLPVGPMSVPAASKPYQLAAAREAVETGQIPAALGDASMRFVGQTSGKALMPKGGVVRQLEQRGMPSGVVKGRERKAMESLLRGHELDEVTLGAKKFDPEYTIKTTHVSPDVVLRERNRLLTMPPEVRPAVTEAMSPIRSVLDTPALERATRTVSGKGLDYGSGPRLSRHARKRISKRMKEITKSPDTPSATEMIREAMEGAA